ncbi:MAG: hypothetical protein MJ252_00860 [archaeon]|nr:hypothetical protein [archaeon]
MADIFTGQYYNSHELMDYYKSTGGYEYLYFRCSDDDFEEFDIGDNYCNEAKPAESYKECRDRILTKGENCCFGQYQLKGQSKKEDFCISMMTKDGRAYKAQEIYDAYKDKYSKKGIAFDNLFIKCGDKDSAGNKAFGLKYSMVLLALVFAILI